MSSQYGELRSITAERSVGGFGAPQQISTGFAFGFVAAPTSLNGDQQNFAGCLVVSWAGTLHIHFWGLLSTKGILPGAKFTLRPSLAFSYIGSVSHGTRAAAVSQTLWRVQGMELRMGHILVVCPMHWIHPVISFSVCLCVCEQIGCRTITSTFFTDFHQILHAAHKCDRFDTYCL